MWDGGVFDREQAVLHAYLYPLRCEVLKKHIEKNDIEVTLIIIYFFVLIHAYTVVIIHRLSLFSVVTLACLT